MLSYSRAVRKPSRARQEALPDRHSVVSLPARRGSVRPLAQHIGYSRTQRRSFDPCSGRCFDWARERCQDSRLEQIEPDFADVAPLRMKTQHSKNRIFVNPECRGPKGLAAAARTEIDDVNSHGEGRRSGSNLLPSFARCRQTINNRCFTAVLGHFERPILYLSG